MIRQIDDACPLIIDALHVRFDLSGGIIFHHPTGVVALEGESDRCAVLLPTPISPQREGWLKFFLRGIQEVSQSATVTARAISNLRENHRQLIADKLGGRASLGMRLLDYLFQQPMISVSLVEKRLDCSFVTANRIVEQLGELALLREITGWQRNRRYRYHPYLALFEALAVPERTQESNSSDESSPTRRQPAM